MSVPARLESQAIDRAAFIAAVQDVGALATVWEADRAVRAVLGELGGCLSWGAAANLAGSLPRPLREMVTRRSFDSAMCRFAPKTFLLRIAGCEGVGVSRAAQDTRAVLQVLDLVLPGVFREQLHAELASLWEPLLLVAREG